MAMPKYRKRRRRNDSNVDDWLMTYADMITLLLCFFAIFLSISVPRSEQMKTAREKVLESFASMEKLREVRSQTENDKTSETDMPYDNLPSIVDRYEKGKGNDGIQDGKNGKNDKVGDDVAPAGDRLVTLEMPSAAFFNVGASTLSPEGEKLLQQVISEHLKNEKTKGFQITVEGHTDDAPIKTAMFPSNWELSTARAAAVVRFFISNGIEPTRLRAAGYADVFPKVPNRDSAGKPIPENQAQNRRVVIKLERVERVE
jgi:chemotaxis protein MotB